MNPIWIQESTIAAAGGEVGNERGEAGGSDCWLWGKQQQGEREMGAGGSGRWERGKERAAVLSAWRKREEEGLTTDREEGEEMEGVEAAEQQGEEAKMKQQRERKGKEGRESGWWHKWRESRTTTRMGRGRVREGAGEGGCELVDDSKWKGEREGKLGLRLN